MGLGDDYCEAGVGLFGHLSISLSRPTGARVGLDGGGYYMHGLWCE